jgi:hypothetical protein
MRTLKRLWKYYNLSIVLFALFILSWVGQGYFQWQEFIQHQKQHNQSAQVSEYIPEFAASTFENWQSEFLQLFSMVVLTAFLIHKGSHESKDNDEDVNRKLLSIEHMLKDLTKHRSSKRG